MKRSEAPPIVPGVDHEVYLVLDDLGPLGRVFIEADEAQADKATVIGNIGSGQYTKPIRVVAFNTAEGWARDVTEDVAREIVDIAGRSGDLLSKPAQAFVEWATGEDVPAQMVERD